MGAIVKPMLRTFSRGSDNTMHPGPDDLLEVCAAATHLPSSHHMTPNGNSTGLPPDFLPSLSYSNFAGMFSGRLTSQDLKKIATAQSLDKSLEVYLPNYPSLPQVLYKFGHAWPQIKHPKALCVTRTLVESMAAL